MKRRTYRRDPLGRFAGAGKKVTGAALGAGIGAAVGSKTARSAVRKATVPGSVKINRTLTTSQAGVSASAAYKVGDIRVDVAGSAKITRPTPTAGRKRAR
ncbi:hypothetical protein [Mycobacteroides chelonae]|uniref:hypothetical protein n=1 Tax=Mycobacteroides chelonae TaxID=1774 RepID=UPI0005C46BB8|nr:hypothetical protein [Mycobacteroides chelonae]MBF9315241.1 hypothetical protein [Mycobacteroides chelonae]OHT73828.1 hypothetical protein BKG66_06205 [Mycobacteroides chelonae]OHT76385.1 hypothetical protein BKG67_03040 [Mycobacteroides chelonae]OHT91679.1 hypothetical protein BKG70_03225 [Mycobacteroides chelonae]